MKETDLTKLQELAGVQLEDSGKFVEFSYDPGRWSENVIEDTLGSMDGVAWDPRAGTLTTGPGPALDALTALVKANVGIRQEFSGERGLAQARRI